jgi:hypothetical protein
MKTLLGTALVLTGLEVGAIRLDVAIGEGERRSEDEAIEYDPDAHWVLRFAAGGSPSSTADAKSAVQVPSATGAAITADARITTTSSSAMSLAHSLRRWSPSRASLYWKRSVPLTSWPPATSIR